MVNLSISQYAKKQRDDHQGAMVRGIKSHETQHDEQGIKSNDVNETQYLF